MELVNGTYLSAFAFRQFDTAGALDCVVAVRGTFMHVQDAKAALTEAQDPFVWTDAYDGDPQTGLLQRQSDLVPGKTGTDITFLGSSHAPGGSASQWQCRMSIGPVDKSIHVTGPRHWLPRKSRAMFLSRQHGVSDWDLTEPYETTAVPIDWRQSFGGGTVFSNDAGDLDPRNPVGCGRLGPQDTWQEETVFAPALSMTPRPDWKDQAVPAGFGPVAPFWKARSQHVGTYDQDWLDKRHPLLPHDFDPKFWNSAPSDQIARPFLRGDEPYALTHLHPDHARASGLLPGIVLWVDTPTVGPCALDLDGVQFDWRETGKILITWRARFPLPNAETAQLHLHWAYMQSQAGAA